MGWGRGGMLGNFHMQYMLANVASTLNVQSLFCNYSTVDYNCIVLKKLSFSFKELSVLFLDYHNPQIC